MICIERDYNRFVLKVNDAGFGKCAVKAASLDTALTAVKHYYGQEHPKSECPMCKSMRRTRGQSDSMSKLQDLNDAVLILRAARAKLPRCTIATPEQREADKIITDATIHLWKRTPVWDLINDQDVI